MDVSENIYSKLFSQTSKKYCCYEITDRLARINFDDLLCDFWLINFRLVFHRRGWRFLPNFNFRFNRKTLFFRFTFVFINCFFFRIFFFFFFLYRLVVLAFAIVSFLFFFIRMVVFRIVVIFFRVTDVFVGIIKLLVADRQRVDFANLKNKLLNFNLIGGVLLQ